MIFTANKQLLLTFLFDGTLFLTVSFFILNIYTSFIEISNLVVEFICKIRLLCEFSISRIIRLLQIQIELILFVSLLLQ